MTFGITLLQQLPNQNGYSSKGFRNIIEEHLEHLKVHDDSQYIELTPFQQIKYTGDFYGLLVDLGFNVDLHWIILRCSGLHSTLAMDDATRTVVVPSDFELRRLLTRYLNSERLN